MVPSLTPVVLIFYSISTDESETDRNGGFVMSNGVVSDYRYYFTLLPYKRNRLVDGRMVEETVNKDYMVGRYRFQDSDHDLYVYHHDLYGLKPGEWLTSSAIDIYTTFLKRSWPQNTAYFPTEDTFFLFRERTVGQELRASHMIFRLNWPDRGLAFLPYLHADHWRLFVINFDSNTCAVIDSLPESEHHLYITEERRVMSLFITYINECRSRGIINPVSQFRPWKMVRFPDRPGGGVKMRLFTGWIKNVVMMIRLRYVKGDIIDRYGQQLRPLQYDSCNCGPFVMWEMNTLAHRKELVGPFDPNIWRVAVAKALIERSEDMTTTCIFCYGEDGGPVTVCSSCLRFYHHECLDGTGVAANEICWPCSIYISNAR
ncbi:hypothetical protein QAD02_007536 [Eretmocerus hayati]|uniref:Uncharacterized protein n=1 Tax=Eretmocerus hayati TaxID=131215 RepID=A0ACC2N3V7_9HYME|nr:hypothetical protein QAD02_007536 [Eretmocerus hayati]